MDGGPHDSTREYSASLPDMTGLNPLYPGLPLGDAQGQTDTAAAVNSELALLVSELKLDMRKNIEEVESGIVNSTAKITAGKYQSLLRRAQTGAQSLTTFLSRVNELATRRDLATIALEQSRTKRASALLEYNNANAVDPPDSILLTKYGNEFLSANMKLNRLNEQVRTMTVMINQILQNARIGRYAIPRSKFSQEVKPIMKHRLLAGAAETEFVPKPDIVTRLTEDQVRKIRERVAVAQTKATPPQASPIAPPAPASVPEPLAAQEAGASGSLAPKRKKPSGDDSPPLQELIFSPNSVMSTLRDAGEDTDNLFTIRSFPCTLDGFELTETTLRMDRYTIVSPIIKIVKGAALLVDDKVKFAYIRLFLYAVQRAPVGMVVYKQTPQVYGAPELWFEYDADTPNCTLHNLHGNNAILAGKVYSVPLKVQDVIHTFKYRWWNEQHVVRLALACIARCMYPTMPEPDRVKDWLERWPDLSPLLSLFDTAVYTVTEDPLAPPATEPRLIQCAFDRALNKLPASQRRIPPLGARTNETYVHATFATSYGICIADATARRTTLISHSQIVQMEVDSEAEA